ncbi:hypothetical protein K4K55_001519 [Colletotrichum sp. SAR 10_96]|nr:hypothetical protein K4K55_001519 [Colletotrichum sp. SAR 10_96]
MSERRPEAVEPISDAASNVDKGSDFVHQEVAGELTPEDQAFLDNFPEDRKKRVMRKNFEGLIAVRVLLAGAFSGLLAFVIVRMDGLAGIAGWRWIFIIEGIASAVAGVATFFLLIDTPALSTRWLDADERKYLELRQYAVQGNSIRVKEAEKTRKWEILRSVLLDWQLYLQALVYWSNTVPNFGMKFTMPQIIKNMGYTSSNAQLLTIPPYIVGVISAYISSSLSDRFKWRMPFIVFAQVLVLISFAILFSKAENIQENIPACYFAIFLASIGFYLINPGGNAWTVNNLAGPTKRAQGIAYMICLGSIGGIVGSFIYREDESPKYPTGFGSSFAFAGLGVVACFVLEFLFWNINRKRDKFTEAEIRAKYSDDELQMMGDRSPLFRYTL